MIQNGIYYSLPIFNIFYRTMMVIDCNGQKLKFNGFLFVNNRNSMKQKYGNWYYYQTKEMKLVVNCIKTNNVYHKQRLKWSLGNHG